MQNPKHDCFVGAYIAEWERRKKPLRNLSVKPTFNTSSAGFTCMNSRPKRGKRTSEKVDVQTSKSSLNFLLNNKHIWLSES